MRVLVVEDDPDLGEILRSGLAEEGYAVDLAATGEDGMWRVTTVDYDVAVLDVLLLTARDATEDRVAGLDAGADDYLVKPFAWDELLARLRALIRRGPHGAEGRLTFANLALDPAQREVRCAGTPVAFTAKEFEILWVLLREPGRVFSRTEILERIYDDDHERDSNVLEVLLSRIRHKLPRTVGTPHIRTVRGVGYALQREDGALPHGGTSARREDPFGCGPGARDA